MQTTLNWRKGLFKCTFQIMAGNFQVGELKDSEFRRTAIGSLNGKKIAFRSKGHLRPKADIIDLNTDRVIGRITYSCWYPKATIEYGDQKAYWNFNNLWETKWSISNHQGVNMAYQGWAPKGSIRIHEQDDLLVLAGLFISNYYWRMAAIWIACFSPILIFV